MSTQNAKKKRLGSRRVAPSQSEVPKADDYHLTESSSVAQQHVLEESTKSLNALSNQENSKPETQHPPSPEVAFTRRKLGSSRKNNRRQFDDSETEPYLNPGKELEKKSRGNKTLDTIQTPQAVELEQQEEFSQGSDGVSALDKDYPESTTHSDVIANSPGGVMEILIPKINSLQAEKPCENETDKYDTQSEEIKENAHAVVQKSNSSDVPDEEPSNVHSVVEMESRKRDNGTNLFRHDGRLQGNYLVNESYIEFVALEGNTPDITSDKNRSEQNTKVVFSVEQETFSSSKEKFTANEDPCNLSEVRETWQSDNATNKAHEVDVKPVESQDMYQNDYSSQSLDIDVTEKADTCSGNLQDQTEIKDAQKKIEHPIKERHLESLDQGNEDNQGYDSKQSADDSVSNEHHTKQRNLETITEENEEGDVDKSYFSESNLPSEVNAPFESQLQDSNMSTSEKTDTVFDPIGKGDKMGSSCRNKGRDHEKQFKKEVLENITSDGTLRTTKISAMTQTTTPEQLTQGHELHVSFSMLHNRSVLVMPGYSTENQNPTETNITEINLGSLSPEREDLQEDQDHRHLRVVSDKPVGAEMDKINKSITSLNEEVRRAHHSENVVKAQEDEVKPTQMQEMPQKDFSSENVIEDATEDSSIIAGDLAQTEISSASWSQMMVQSADESAIKLEVSTPDDKQGEHHFLTEEHEECNARDSKDEEVSLQTPPSEVNTPFESQLEGGIANVDEQSHSVFDRGNKRKMGSSRRNKGRQREKKFNNEDTIVDEIPETTKMSATEMTRPEELLQESERDVPLFVPSDSSTFTASTPTHATEFLNPTAASYPEISWESFTSESENFQENQNQTVLNVLSNEQADAGMEEVERDETLQNEVKDTHHSEDAVKKVQEEEVKPSQMQEMQQKDFSSENVIEDATEDSSIIAGDLAQTEISSASWSQMMVQSADESAIKLEVSTPADKQGEHHFLTEEHEECNARDSKDEEVSLQTPPSEVNTPFESQLEGGIANVDEQSHSVFDRGNKRKMGSSRRNKGRQREKKFNNEDTIVDEIPETTKMSATEMTRPEELLQESERDVPLFVPSDSSTFTASTPTHATEFLNPTAASYPEISWESFTSESENFQENQNQTVLNVLSNEQADAGMEEVERDETLQNEVKDTHHSEDAVKKVQEEEVKPSQMQEMQQKDFSSENVIEDATEDSSIIAGDLAQTEISSASWSQMMVQSADESAIKLEVSTPDDKQGEHHFLTEEHEECNARDSKDEEVSLQTPPSEVNTPFESQLEGGIANVDEQRHSVFDRGNKRKMGSSRRNKGRQREKKFNNEDTIVDEIPETTKMSATEMTRPEELLQESERDVPLFVPSDSSTFTASTPTHATEFLNPTAASYPEISWESFTSESENFQENQNQTVLNVLSNEQADAGMEEVERDETLQNEVKDTHHSEDAVKKVQEEEVKPSQMQEMPQKDFSSENVIEDATEDSSIIAGDLAQTEISSASWSQMMVQSADESAIKLEVSTPADKQGEHHFLTEEHEECNARDSKDEEVSLQTPPSEVNTPFESQLEGGIANVDEQSHSVFDRGNKRKMGSSRRNKGRQREKKFNNEDTIVDEIPETTKMSATEMTRPEELLQESERDVPLFVPSDSSTFTASTPTHATEFLNPTAASYPEISWESFTSESENFQENQNQTVLNVLSNEQADAGMEEVERDETLQNEVKDTHHSEDAVKKVQEEEVKPSQMQEMPQKDFSSENVIEDATEDSSIIAGDLAQTEISSASWSQMMVQSADESAIKLEVSTPADKQGEHHFLTEEHEECNARDSKDEEVSLQTPPSEVNTPFESQLEGGIANVDEQSHSVFDRGNKRKMGSSRRNKGRQREKKFNNEDTIVDEIPETTKMSATEMTRPEELLQESERDVPLFVPSDSSTFTASTPTHATEFLNPTAASYPEISWESFTSESENFQENQNQTVLNVLSNEQADAGMEEVERDETLQNEVKDTHHSEDAVKKVQEEEVKPSQMQEMPQKDFSSENVIEDATEDSSIISGDLAQTEISSASWSQMMVQSADESAIKLEVSTPDDKQDEHHFLTEEHEECNARDSKDEEVSLQTPPSEVNTPFESQLEGGIANVDEQSHSVFDRGNKRKMGSSRRNKGRQREKKFNNEDTIVDEIPETTKMSATEMTRPEELLQESERDVPLFVPSDSSTFTASTPTHATEFLNPTAASYPEISWESFTSESENFQENQNQTVLNVLSNEQADAGMEEVERDETLQNEVKDTHHSEDAVKKVQEEEVKPSQMQEMPQKDFSPENVIEDATEDSSIIAGDLAQTEISSASWSQMMVQSADESAIKLEVSTPADKQGEHHFLTEEHEECNARDSKDEEVSLQTPPSEVNTPFESQLEGGIANVDEQSHSVFDRGNKRKMGSSRRNKGRQREKKFNNEDTIVDEIPETTKMSATEMTRPEELLQESERDVPLFVPSDSSTFTASTPTHATEFLNPTAASYPEISWESFTSESENFQENQNQTVLNVLSDKEVFSRMEEVDKQDDTELLTQNANLHGNNLFTGATDCMITSEIKPAESSLRGSSDAECRVVQEAFVLSTDVLSTNREEHEHCNPAQQSEGASVHQTEYISITEREYSHQTPLSETNIPLDFQPQDNSQSATEGHTALSRAGNRKKLGSSRRNKVREHVSYTDAYQELKDEVVENPTSDEALKTVKMSPSTDIAKEEQAEYLTEKAMQISSAANEDKNTKKVSEEDPFFLQNDMDSNSVVTSGSNLCLNKDAFLNSNKYVNEENKLVEETEDLDQLTGCDTVTKHLMQSPQASVCNVVSDMQHISYHDGIISSSSVEVLNKEVFQIQNVTTLSSDEDLLGEQIEGMNTSSEAVSSAKEPALRASDGMAISNAMHASSNKQEQSQSDNIKNLQINPKQKRRKMGSTRRSQLNRKNEEETDSTDETKKSEFNAEAVMRTLDKMHAGELLLTTEVSENETAQPLFSAVHKQQETDEATSIQNSTESNMTPVEDFKATLLKQSTSLSEETINPVTCIKVGDVREVIVELPLLDDCTNSEALITTVVTGRSRCSINQLLPPNTEAAADTGITERSSVSSTEARQTTQSDTERPESIKVIQEQDANEKKPNDLNDGDLDKSPEMKNSSPNQNSTNRRRKMGSTRKNLASRNKEDIRQQQEEDNEAKEMGTNVADSESVPGIKEELQLHTDPKDSNHEQAKEKVFETVEISPPGQSQVKFLAEQTVEERPVSQGQLVETEHRLTANYLPSSSPNNDIVSESASGGRKRKMGSSRKTRGHQRTEVQTAEDAIIDDQNGRDAKISEAEESDKKPSSVISKSGEHAKDVSEKTSAKPCNTEIFLGQESQTLSLVNNPGRTDLKSKRYDVVMIGDSSVGKTSFMKRAQSGKFSLDLPASIGLDSLIWPVVVDGKPLVLQLWDTAGQERFHSITKQVFHKARAFLLMYDITSTKSFSAVSYWANCIQESAAENVIVLLLGNKSDCSQRQVKSHQGEILAKEYDFEFMECSAATGENVIQSLEIVARKLSQRIDTREEATVLHQEPEQKKSSRCC